MSIVLGITGGLSTGKSTVTLAFKRLGAKVFDADLWAHDLLKKKSSCFNRVVEVFGENILMKGEIDRRKLAEIVFKNTAKRKKLERIIHPEVERKIDREIRAFKKNQRKAFLVLDVPLLFEAGLDTKVDYAIVVKSKVTQQIERSVKKIGITQAEAKRRIKAQMPIRDKIRKADIVIDNSKTKTETIKKVKEIWQKIWIRIKK